MVSRLSGELRLIREGKAIQELQVPEAFDRFFALAFPTTNYSGDTRSGG